MLILIDNRFLSIGSQMLEKRLRKRVGKNVKRKSHKLTQFAECKGINDESECYEHVSISLIILHESYTYLINLNPVIFSSGVRYFRRVLSNEIVHVANICR
jgi:hypothetical protein